MITKTPILLIFFNNLDTTVKVLNQVKKYKPNKIYLACDGPRDSMQWEKEKLEIIRNTIIQLIDWPCDINRFFRDNNMWTSKWIVQFIDWFFSLEEFWIILEHDCYPSDSFFEFCDLMLFKYKDDKRIMHIWWYTLINNFWSYDYYYWNIPMIWGWASWSDRWSKYSFEMNDLQFFLKSDYLVKNFKQWHVIKWRKYMFLAAQIWWNSGTFSTWDFQWTYAIFKNWWLAIYPCINLVENIWFWEFAVHCKDINSFLANNKCLKFERPIILRNENIIHLDVEFSDLIFANTFYVWKYDWIKISFANLLRKLHLYSFIKKLLISLTRSL